MSNITYSGVPYISRLLLITALLGLNSCDQKGSQQELFDSVWQIIYETYPDSTFGNIDWIAVGDRYRQQLPTITNEDDLIDKLNQMLFELKVSHVFMGRISQIEQKASPYMFKPGSPELDIRILDDQVVVTRVDSKPRVEQKTLVPGSIIRKIDNRVVSDIIAAASIYPPYNDRYRRFLQTEEVLRYLYGDVGSSVRIDFLDLDGNPDVVDIVRTVRINEIQLSADLPPVYLEYKWRILENDIGYLRFNAFQPENPIAILSTIDSLSKAKAFVIDLRGNNGGSLEAQRLIAARFFKNLVVGAFIEGRNRIDTLFYEGNENAYTARIAILVDETSISGAELFPATLQSLGRAVVVGSPTPGAVMGGTLDFLNDSLVLVHPTLVIKTNRGTDLEGVGVIPDIIVPLDRELLTKGVDSQLKAAVTFLTSGPPGSDQ